MIGRVAAAVCLLSPNVGWGSCEVDRVTVFGDWGQARFEVRVADEPAERSQGLMFVESMPLLEGMLFVYPQAQRATFWMRNTLIPLDMIFAAPSGEVLSIHENAIPLDQTTIDGGEGIQYVLEINGGLASRLGITVGDVLQHPSIDQSAIKPCEK